MKKGKSREKGNGETPPKSKRGGAAQHESTGAADADEAGGAKHPTPTPEDPLNFADVESRLARHAEHFGEALKKLRSGGRFNADAIGALRVVVGGETHPLRDVAQVVARPGTRAVSILAHEASAIKPILSAVQASPDFNQQPQRDPDNELELTLKIEPERREDVVKRVKAACHEWRERVRQVRQRRDKLHAGWRKEGAIVPDLQRTADKELDKVIKAKMGEIDAAEKDALKATEGGK